MIYFQGLITGARDAFSARYFLWSAGIIVFPFYLFPKGGLQISTFLLFGAALWQISGERALPRAALQKVSVLVALFAGFVGYALLVQGVWALILADFSILIAAVFYFFNFVVFYALARGICGDPKLAQVIVNVAALAVLLQCLLSLFSVSGGMRNTLYFQNPNQLGYFSLLAACILTVGVRMKLTDAGTFTLGMVACIWLAQLSLSKSAMFSGVLLLAYGGARSGATLVVGVLLIVSIAVFGAFEARVDAVSMRLEGVGQAEDDTAAARGYDRIWLHPEMNVLGGGEGAVYRWDSLLDTGEMHSSWGTILFSYGVPGVLLLATFFLRIGGMLGIASAIPLLVVVLYGLTHHGLRFVPMWMLCALIAGIGSRRAAVLAARRQLMSRRRLANARGKPSLPRILRGG